MKGRRVYGRDNDGWDYRERNGLEASHEKEGSSLPSSQYMYIQYVLPSAEFAQPLRPRGHEHSLSERVWHAPYTQAHPQVTCGNAVCGSIELECVA